MGLDRAMDTKEVQEALGPVDTRDNASREVELPVIRSAHPGTMDLSGFDFDDLLA